MANGTGLQPIALLWTVVLHLLLLRITTADVLVMTTRSPLDLDPFPDLPADFGPEVPEEGIEGRLVLANPEDSCAPYTLQKLDTPWVALIARQQQPVRSLNCTFDIKVRYAQEAGAVAAIVYDDVSEPLIIMSKPHGRPDPLIPAVFVTERAGILMKKLMDIDEIYVRITPVSALAWISMLMSAFLGLLALTVVFATFYVMRSWSLWLAQGRPAPGGGPQAGGGGLHLQAHHGGLSPSALRSLPVLIYESAPPSRAAPSLASSLTHAPAGPIAGAPLGGDLEEGESEVVPAPAAEAGETSAAAPDVAERSQSSRSSSSNGGACDGKDGVGSSASSEYEVTLPPGVHAGETKRMCAICLEAYAEGEKVRVLPCHHRFHMACVDQWLSTRRVCPVCKHDASVALVQPPQGCRPSHSSASGSAVAAAAAAVAELRRSLWESMQQGRAGRRNAMRARFMAMLGGVTEQHQDMPAAAAAADLQQPLLQPEEEEQAAAPAAGATAEGAAGGAGSINAGDVEAAVHVPRSGADAQGNSSSQSGEDAPAAAAAGRWWQWWRRTQRPQAGADASSSSGPQGAAAAAVAAADSAAANLV